MKRPLIILLLVAILGGGFLYWRSLPQNAMPRQIRGLVETASFDADLSNVGRTGKALAVSDYFTDPVTFESPYSEFGGSYDLVDLRPQFAGLTQWATTARFFAENITVEDFDDTSGHATASTGVDAIFKGGSTRSEKATATFYFEKIDGKWLISRVKLDKE